MNILDTIVAEKKLEVLQLQKTFVADEKLLSRNCISLVKKLQRPNSTGIIAEFKRKSPSKGFFKDELTDIIPIVKAYEAFGAAGVSILTDTKFFGGSTADVIAARELLQIPILRKDFIIDALQITEAKQMGADVVLLIAAILTPTQVKHLTIHAQNLGLEVLLELHEPTEVDRLYEAVDMIGINNRNLKTFTVDIEQSILLANALPHNKPKIAESGIENAETIAHFKKHGFCGFLIGEQFMKQADTATAFNHFVKNLN
jgi:indole-3-glycerol phosphate synthase